VLGVSEGVLEPTHLHAQGDQLAADVRPLRRLAVNALVEEMGVLEVPAAGPCEQQVGKPDDRVVVVRSELQVLLEVEDRIVRLAFLRRRIRLPEQCVRNASSLHPLQDDEPAPDEQQDQYDAQ
jgi:hypothetical protein